MDLPVNNNSQQGQLERTTSVEEQKDNEPVKLTPEQEEEIKLRSKYPNPQKPGGSAFIQKMLHKGSKKYFDSGDYNMAKSKNRALNNTARQQQQQSTQIQLNVENNSDVDISSTTTTTTTTASIDVQQINDSNNKLNIINEDTLNNSTTSINNQISSSSCQSPVISSSNNNNNNNSLNISANSASLQSSPSIQNNNHHYHHLSTSNQASPLMTTPQSSVGLSSSISSSSLSMHLNPSVSLDKLSNINPMLDSEEIGHGIPTPECLPQSRKHSIAQSKLATPRVSSS